MRTNFMKKKRVRMLLAVLLAICQLAGCGSSDDGQIGYENKYEKDFQYDDIETEKDTDVTNLETDAPSIIEGNWYAFDSVKRKGDDIQRVTFKNNIFYGENMDEFHEEMSDEFSFLSDLYKEIPYEYDEKNEILTLDYRKIFEETEKILENADGEILEEEKKEIREELESAKRQSPEGLLQVYAPLYDDILFFYPEYFVPEGVNEYSEYDNPNFPNSVIFLEKNGKYYTLGGVYCRKAEFPNVRSMSLALGSETIEGCLCSYYANWVGSLSVGFLEKVYGIYDSDIITVQQEIEEAEFDPDKVDDENLSIENIEDVPMENSVWEFYWDCPLEEVKYVTFSHDTDSGRQTSGVYLGKTYGLWSVLWTNGEL